MRTPTQARAQNSRPHYQLLTVAYFWPWIMNIQNIKQLEAYIYSLQEGRLLQSLSFCLNKNFMGSSRSAMISTKGLWLSVSSRYFGMLVPIYNKKIKNRVTRKKSLQLKLYIYMYIYV